MRKVNNNILWHRALRRFLPALFLMTVCSCSDNEESPGSGSQTEWTTQKVVVVLPLGENEDYEKRVVRTAEWFTENFEQAQSLLETGVRLELEWYDETTVDLENLAETLVDRDDVLAIIGPHYSVNLDVMAAVLSLHLKPMIAPIASSEEIVRKYSCGEAGTRTKRPFLWSLSETDISQSEVILSRIQSFGGETFAMITPENSYGKTFYEWTPFQAREMGLQLVSNLQYTDEASLRQVAQQTLTSGADYVVCAMSDAAECATVLEVRNALGDAAPQLFFTDTSMTPELLSQGQAAEGVQGTAMYADPTSGFQISYEERFGETPTVVEPQFYDALLLVGLGANYLLSGQAEDLNAALQDLTLPREGEPKIGWNAMGMVECRTLIEAGNLPRIKGAGGILEFDESSLTSVLHSTYVHWMVYNGEFVSIDYASSDPDNRTSETMASWNWRIQDSSININEGQSIDYPELQDQWAVLVGGSDTWANYRHQADVLNLYQQLRANGFDDDHIILILRDDLAYHEQNPEQGVIRATPDGANLYENVQIDYRADTLTTADIPLIMTGQSSAHLPVTLNTNSHSNVLFYWSGHGMSGAFPWLSQDDYFNAETLSTMLQAMSGADCFRKLLICTEPCFSGGVVSVSEGLPGILSIASCAADESSFADTYSTELRTWMSDRFSNNLVTCAGGDPDMSFYDLYQYLVSHTLGSHVGIYNATNFDNLRLATLGEFFHKQ